MNTSEKAAVAIWKQVEWILSYWKPHEKILKNGEMVDGQNWGVIFYETANQSYSMFGLLNAITEDMQNVFDA